MYFYTDTTADDGRMLWFPVEYDNLLYCWQTFIKNYVSAQYLKDKLMDFGMCIDIVKSYVASVCKKTMPPTFASLNMAKCTVQ